MENNGIKTLEEVSSFNDLNLHESFRAHMLYEEVSGESFKPTNLKSILIFFYATIMACNREFASDFDTFVDWLDGHPSYVEFDQLVIGQWGALDIVVDPYTRAKFAEVVLTINAWFDAKLLRAGAVKCATYSAPSA